MIWYYLFNDPNHTQLDFFAETALQGWSLSVIKLDKKKCGYDFLARVSAGKKAKSWADKLCEGGREIQLTEAAALSPQVTG